VYVVPSNLSGCVLFCLVNLAFASSPWLVNQTNVIYVSNDQKIQAAVANMYGAIGVVAVTNQLESTVRNISSTLFVFYFLVHMSEGRPLSFFSPPTGHENAIEKVNWRSGH
jgi:hypothetical protein